MAGSTPQPGAGNKLKISRAEDAVHVQVIGLGNMFLAPALQGLVESELQAGFANFVIDLRRCDGMDSTFMGTFIGLSTQIRARLGWFCLVNVSSENKRLLQMLGVLHMVSIHEGEFPMPSGDAKTLYPTTDPYMRQKQIHSAHRLLIDADPENEKRFGPFIKAMEAEMKAMETETSDIPTILPPGGQPNGASPENGAGISG